MKNTSKSLKSRGYKVVDTKKPKVELDQSIEKIVKSFTDVTKDLQQQNNDNSTNLNRVLNKISQKPEPIIIQEASTKKTWEFDVQRSKDGFISKILAREI